MDFVDLTASFNTETLFWKVIKIFSISLEGLNMMILFYREMPNWFLFGVSEFSDFLNVSCSIK